jgi:zinc protease
MTRRCRTPVLVCALVALLPYASVAQRIELPPQTTHTLGNGLRVLLMPYRRVPLVHFRLVAGGGSAYDPQGLEGVASITTSLMREGTTSRTSTELAGAIDFTGGYLTVAAGQDYCAARAEFLARDAATGLDLFADVIMHPVFPQGEIERERKLRLASLDAIKEEPSAIASVVFNREVYGGHPYGRQTAGTRTSLERMSRDDITAFHRQTFVPGNCILAVVGDFDAGEMLEMIKVRFSTWAASPGAQTRLLPPPRRIAGRKVIVVNKPDQTQSQILIGNTGIDLKHPDIFAVTIANTIFGGGYTSRLVEELRIRRSLTYGASSGFPANMFGGTFVVSTFTRNETLGEALEVTFHELTKYRETGPTQEELTKAQNYVAGSFARSLQAPGALASRITDRVFYEFPDDYLAMYIPRLKAVTVQQTMKVIREFFPVDDLLIVLVAPADQARIAGEQFGDVRVVELSDAIE